MLVVPADQVNAAVSGLLLLATFAILRLQFGHDWNSELFPKHPQKVLYNYGFWVVSADQAVFAALYGLLVFYWVNERFMDIVFHLTGLMGLALVVGNMALANLARDAANPTPTQAKEKQD